MPLNTPGLITWRHPWPATRKPVFDSQLFPIFVHSIMPFNSFHERQLALGMLHWLLFFLFPLHDESQAFDFKVHIHGLSSDVFKPKFCLEESYPSPLLMERRAIISLCWSLQDSENWWRFFCTRLMHSFWFFLQLCVVSGCGKKVEQHSVFCSDECIEKHVAAVKEGKVSNAHLAEWDLMLFY